MQIYQMPDDGMIHVLDVAHSCLERNNIGHLQRMLITMETASEQEGDEDIGNWDSTRPQHIIST